MANQMLSTFAQLACADVTAAAAVDVPRPLECVPGLARGLVIEGRTDCSVRIADGAAVRETHDRPALPFPTELGTQLCSVDFKGGEWPGPAVLLHLVPAAEQLPSHTVAALELTRGLRFAASAQRAQRQPCPTD